MQGRYSGRVLHQVDTLSRCCHHFVGFLTALNRYPALKSFLTHGEAEYYQGVTVTFVKGRKAVMKIFQDGQEVEEIDLQNLDDKDKLHETFQAKGFKLREDLTKSLEELRAESDARAEEEKRQKDEARKRRLAKRAEMRKMREEESAAKEFERQASSDGAKTEL